jgi:hypothetical protein
MPPFAYEMHEMAHLALAPARALSDVARTGLESPINPLSYTAAGRNLAASANVFERLTRRYDKPRFGLGTTAVGGKTIPVGWFGSGRFASSILKSSLTPAPPRRARSFFSSRRCQVIMRPSCAAPWRRFRKKTQ